MKIELVRTLNEFLNVIHKTDYFNNNWYRGHKETSYRLEPSAFRTKVPIITGSKPIQCRHYEINDEQLAIKEFKNNFNPSIEGYKFCDLDYLYLMQHNGIETRLLDFTFNPLIALFFSVIEKKEISRDKENFESKDEFDKECSAVFCINPIQINRLSFGQDKIIDLSYLKFDKIRELLTPVCIQPNNLAIDRRLEIQNGKFVLFGKEVNPLDWYDEPRKTMLKIIIPNSQRPKIQKELEQKFKINYKSIYPDNEGLKLHIQKKIEGKFKKL